MSRVTYGGGTQCLDSRWRKNIYIYMIYQPLANKRNYGTIMNNPFYAKSTRALSRQQLWAGTILHWPIKSPHPEVTFCQIGGSGSKWWFPFPKKIGIGKSYRLSNGCPLKTQNNLILQKSFALESNPRTASVCDDACWRGLSIQSFSFHKQQYDSSLFMRG